MTATVTTPAAAAIRMLALGLAAESIPAGLTLQTLEVATKDEATKKFIPQAKVEYLLPLVAAFGVSAEQAKDEKGALLFSEGVPVYTSDAANWLQAAIGQALRIQIRNKLDKDGSLKDGHSIPLDLAAIVAPTEANNGAALRVILEAKKDFAAWVAGLGKTPATQTLLNTLFSNKQALATQDAGTKAKIAGYFTDFAESLDVAKLEAYQRYIDSLLALCEAQTAADDF